MKHFHAVILLSLALFYSFLVSAPPSIFPGDSPEVTAAAAGLGIMHPPGYPLYAMSGKIFSLIMPGDEAFKLNLFSSFTAVFLFIQLYFFLRVILRKYAAGVVLFASCAGGALLFVSSPLFRLNAMTAKGGIYITALLGIMTAFYFTIRASEEKNPRFAYLVFFISGLLPNLHQSAVFPALFASVICFYACKKNINLFLGALFFAIALVTPPLYLFIRAGSDAAFLWGGVSSVQDVISHILRKTYAMPDAVPFGFSSVINKSFSYAAGAVIDYGPALLFAGAGIYFLYKNSRKVFYGAAAYFAGNMIIIMAATSNDVSELYRYVNANFYLVPGLLGALLFAAGGLFAVKVAEKYRLKTVAAVFMALCVIYAAVWGYAKTDFRNGFDSYDYAGSLLSQPGDGGILFGKTDISIYPAFYLKHVKNKYSDVRLYDSNANVADVSIFSEARKNGFMRKEEQDIELGLIRSNPDRVHYVDHTEFPEQGLRTVPYGIVCRIRGISDAQIEMQDNLIKLVSFRNVTDKTVQNDYFRRETAGILLARAAESLAYEGRRERFEIYRMLAEDRGRGVSSVSKSIASIYFHYFNDTYKALLYLERAAKEAPYDFAVVELLINIYSASGVKEKVLQWLKHYEKREWRKERLEVIRQEIKKLEYK